MEDELLCRGIGSVGLNWKVITKEWLNNSKSGKECKSRWENALRTKMALRAQAAECKNDICSTHHHPYLSSPYFLPNYTLSPPCNNNNYHGRQGKSLNQTNNDQGRIATSSSSSSSSLASTPMTTTTTIKTTSKKRKQTTIRRRREIEILETKALFGDRTLTKLEYQLVLRAYIVGQSRSHKLLKMNGIAGEDGRRRRPTTTTTKKRPLLMRGSNSYPCKISFASLVTEMERIGCEQFVSTHNIVSRSVGRLCKGENEGDVFLKKNVENYSNNNMDDDKIVHKCDETGSTNDDKSKNKKQEKNGGKKKMLLGDYIDFTMTELPAMEALDASRLEILINAEKDKDVVGKQSNMNQHSNNNDDDDNNNNNHDYANNSASSSGMDSDYDSDRIDEKLIEFGSPRLSNEFPCVHD